MRTTFQSEYLPIKQVLVKRVEDAFINQGKLANEWRSLNFLDCPDFEKAKEEHDIWVWKIKSEGAEVLYLDAQNDLSIDSIYCRDASIVTDHGVILCNMGKANRVGEPKALLQFYLKNGFKILGDIRAPGTIEGGDVAWLDENTLAVGNSYRTNDEGIRQLKSLLEPLGIKIIVADLPHYRGKTDVFHLMSILSPVDKNLAVVYSPLMPIRFRNELLHRGFEFVEVPEQEFDSMGCNVLAIAPSVCVIEKNNPITISNLEKAGCKVITYDGKNISVFGGGGPTCLTRPLERISL